MNQIAWALIAFGLAIAAIYSPVFLMEMTPETTGHKLYRLAPGLAAVLMILIGAFILKKKRR